ncbi:MAG: AMP-binding protein [Firmicutes bacterium]|nr:AMP-binding protein [Bacillota bacterium]
MNTKAVIKGKKFKKYWYEDIREIVTLKDMLKGSAELYWSNPAFWVKEKRGAEYKAVNYGLLQHDVNALGTKLVNMGLKGSRIAVMGQGCYEWIVSYLSVINGTGVVVPIDKELTGAEIGNLMKAGGCDTIFCTRNECKKLRGIPEVRRLIVMDFYGDRTDPSVEPEPTDLVEADPGVEVYSWRKLLLEGERLLEQGERGFMEAEIDPDEMAVILFTSGTTGNPKGVMLSHRNITSNIMDVCRICQVYESDKTLSILPIHHTYECTLGMLLVIYRGASTAFSEGMKYITQNMKEAQNTFIIVVPRVLEMVYSSILKGVEKQGKQKAFAALLKVNKGLRRAGINVSRTLFGTVLNALGGKLRVVITGAAALNPDILRAFEEFGITVLQGYGMTECTPLIAGTPGSAPKERYLKAGSVGTVVDSGEVKIVDQDEYGIGEILFKGPNVMLGYYDMPEETARVIEPDGFMHTGDLGYADKDGWLYLTGRKKNVIVTKTGENVYPEEIEDIISGYAAIDECMVFPYHDNGEETVAIQILPVKEVVETRLGHEATEEDLDKYFTDLVKEFNQRLAPYKRIKHVFVRKQDFVRTTTRKIRRQDNPVSAETVIGYEE